MKFHKSSSAGVALIIVLGFLVIISALAVAFFSSVTTELKASRNFAAGVTTHQLADSAVQMVMGQIRDATTRTSGCWASQPGMIRVYRDAAGAPSANADAFLKLYSSNNMVVTKNQLGNFDPTSDYYNGWASNPAYWTDLNAPVLVTNATNPTGPKVARYPIIDPSASALVDGFSANGSMVGATQLAGATDDVGNPASTLPMPVQWIYVLQDGTLIAPDAGGAIQAGTKATFSGSVAGISPPSQTNPIVGRIAFWTDDESSKLNLNTAAGFMPGNPPTGYTIDTYAGSFWDTPRFYSSFDMGTPDNKGMPRSPGGGGLAICQLLQNEFQRYPGHPATTSLSPVFRTMMTSDQMYTMSPRYSFTSMNASVVGSGSSEGGTWRVVVGTSIPNPTPNVFQIQPKLDRLYASVDELLFAAHSSFPSNNPAYLRKTNNSYIGLAGGTLASLSPQFLDKVRFFLTTQSRAPELNLFGQPRISIWPVRYQTGGEGTSLPTNGLNAFDNTILFCSSVGQSTNTTPPNTESVPPTTPTSLSPASQTPGVAGTAALPYRYIFTRREMRSPSTTYSNDQLSATWGTTGEDINEYRNSQLIHYLQNLTGSGGNLSGNGGINYTAIPGFGGSFVGKYQTLNRDNILTEIFDYIRCANAIDTTSMSPTAFTNGTPTGTGASGQNINNGNPAPFAPQGLIMPSRVSFDGSNYMHGMGRFPTVSEASLVFYYAGPRWADWVAQKGSAMANLATSDFSNPTILVDPTTKYPTVRRYRAFLLLSTFNPMQGYAPTFNPTQNAPKISFVVTGLDQLLMSTWQPGVSGGWAQGSIKDQPIFPSTNCTSPYNVTYTSNATHWGTKLSVGSGGAWGGRNYGGYEGFMHTLIGQNLSWAPHKIARGNVTGSETSSATNANYLQYPYNSISAGASLNSNTAATTYGAFPGQYQEFYELQSPDPDLYPALELQVPVVIQEPGKSAKQDLSDQVFSISASKNASTPTAAKVQVQVTYGGSPLSSPAIPGVLVQTLSLKFQPTYATAGPPPAGTQLWPLPGGDPTMAMTKGDPQGTNALPAKWETLGGAYSTYLNKYYWNDTGSFYPAYHQTGGSQANTAFQTHLWSAWSLPARICWSMQNSWNPQENSAQAAVNYYNYRWRQIVQPGDTIRSLVYCNTPKPVGTTNTGDMRLALLQDNPSDYYPHPEYFTTYSRACLLRMADGEQYFPPGGYPTVGTGIGFSYPSLTSGSAVSMDTGWGNHIPLGGKYPGQSGPAKFPATVAFGNLPYSASGTYGGVNGVVLQGSTASNPLIGDFDTGIGSNPDGPFGNKQDEGNVIYAYQDPLTGIWYYPIPYFSGTWQYAAPGNTYTSPCRQMPSPAMFGSLPSQPLTVNPDNTIGQGWTTLCFCPNPAAGSVHPGIAMTPKDHLLLDLFQMPVVEPYPISEPFSTAGKVNLNYKIAPFGYITRTTALRGVLTPMRVSAVPGTTSNSWSDNYLTYKSGQRDSSGNPKYDTTQNQANVQIALPVTTNYRSRVDVDATITNSFEPFFAQGAGNNNLGFFKSASQICEMYWYPVGLGSTSISTYWSQNTLTGDNVREKPYVDLYNRVTTKSNTFTVHMRVQTLRQLPRSNGDYTTWNEGKDVVLGEYRGSSTIERYIDPADRRFDPSNTVTQTKNDGVNPDTMPLENIYRFRTVITKKFSP